MQPCLISTKGAKSVNWDIKLIQPSLSDNKGTKSIDKGSYINFGGIKNIYIKDVFLLEVLISRIYLLEMFALKISIYEVLVSLSTWKCTCNLSKS